MRMTNLVRRVASGSTVVLLVASVAGAGVVAAGRDDAEPVERVAAGPDLDPFTLAVADVTTTTVPPPPPTTTAPPPTTTVAPRPAPTPTTPATRPRAAARPARPAASSAPRVPPLQPPAVPVGLEPYRGMGTWSDVYDWSHSYANGRPATGLGDVDRMADEGVQTLYIQASKWDSQGDVVDPHVLQPLLDRAKERGLRVVAWYLPTLSDTQRDLQRLVAIAGLRNVDSIGVDIESREVKDVGERNRRLVELSAALRQALPGRTIGAIVLPPVVLEVVNTSYWPNFPYRELAAHYDVWLTMGYWTNRKQSSGYRDAYRYTRENVDRLRANLGVAVPVHPIGGLGAGTTPADVEAYRQAAIDTGALGGSLYDWRTTSADCWAGMRGFRAQG